MEPEATPKPQKKVEYRVPPEGICRVYSNNIQLASTSFDVRVVFGQVGEVSDEKVTVDQLAQVTLSWAEAKILGEFLTANIKAFEDLNGPIRLPKNVEKIVAPDSSHMLPK